MGLMAMTHSVPMMYSAVGLAAANVPIDGWRILVLLAEWIPMFDTRPAIRIELAGTLYT